MAWSPTSTSDAHVVACFVSVVLDGGAGQAFSLDPLRVSRSIPDRTLCRVIMRLFGASDRTQ